MVEVLVACDEDVLAVTLVVELEVEVEVDVEVLAGFAFAVVELANARSSGMVVRFVGLVLLVVVVTRSSSVSISAAVVVVLDSGLGVLSSDRIEVSDPVHAETTSAAAATAEVQRSAKESEVLRRGFIRWVYRLKCDAY